MMRQMQKWLLMCFRSAKMVSKIARQYVDYLRHLLRLRLSQEELSVLVASISQSIASSALVG